MQLVYIRELVLKRASPLFLNGPASATVFEPQSRRAGEQRYRARGPMEIGDHADLHRLGAGVAGRVSRLRMTSANVDRIMALRGRAGR